MRVVVQVPKFDAKTGEPRVVLTPLFEFFDLSADEGKANATVRYARTQEIAAAPGRVTTLGAY